MCHLGKARRILCVQISSGLALVHCRPQVRLIRNEVAPTREILPHYLIVIALY